MEGITQQTTCPSCQAAITAADNFCPKCGAELKGAPVTISAGRKVFIYLVSFFLAPFGLGYAFKYLQRSEPEARRVGVVVIVLTVLAIALMIWVSAAFTSWETQSLDSLGLL
ncbi:MAG: zinc ribbon domain-containing protein [Candidatus Niyogibacteria bacterium]|nr:zinc ribbon domain-containing protein [Candidatus Niyogibacteria bacterium]